MPEGTTLRKRQGDNKGHGNSKSKSGGHGAKKGKAAAENRQSLQTFGYFSVVIVIALGVSYLHYRHVFNLFENDRFFSHLSSLERQMSFRTEMGLYYSYYKTMIDAPSVSQGLEAILYDNVTEYPSTINVLKRFNLYPEVFLGAGYHFYSGFLKAVNRKGKSCFQVNRGHGQPPIESCEGMGDESYFYVTPIFVLNGLYTGILFLTSWYLGGGIVGGLLTAAAFFFNHGEGTRVMWTPPLRESFAVPFLFLQILVVTYVIKAPTLTMKHMTLLTVSTITFMLPWQFAQFVLLTQILSLFGCYSLQLIPLRKMCFFLISMSISLLLNFILQFANAMLLTSFYCAGLLSAWIIILGEPFFKKLQYRLLICVSQVTALLVLTVGSKRVITALANVADDAHIGNLLKAKFFATRDFHTSLYLCSKEFDFIEQESVLLMTKTLLLPVGGFVILVILVKVFLAVFRELLSTDENAEAGPEQTNVAESESLGRDLCKPHAVLLYHALQNLAFIAMAALIMRLKLFVTPHLCILAGLLASEKLFGLVQRHIRLLLVAVIGCCMALQGYANLQKELGTIGEFNDPMQEQLVDWIQTKTAKNSVFAGSMPTMAGVKLNAYRPVVNHPHYEDVDIRRRTLKVYQIYSRKPPAEVAATLRGMQVNYVIVENGWCVRSNGPGCSMGEMWDVEDPPNAGRPLFCSLINEGRIPKPFRAVFQNEVYVVLKVS